MSTRPYRLWDPQLKQYMRWRYYSIPRNAHMGALIEARWAHVGTTIEVVNADTGRMLGQYKRLVNSVSFLK